MTLTPAQRRWNDLIDQQEAAGLSNDEFAAQHNLNVRTLGWYRCKLGRSDKNYRRDRKKREDPTPSSFVEVRVQAPEASDPTVVLAFEEYPAHIVVDEQTDLRLLRQVLAALC